MVGAAGALVAFSLTLTLVAGPLFAYTARAAETCSTAELYISTVLPGGTP